jgi:hypothetical protein
MIHHILLLIGTLNATQLEGLIAALNDKLRDDAEQPLAQAVLISGDELSCPTVVSPIVAGRAEHERLWGAIDKLDERIEKLNVNRNSF